MTCFSNVRRRSGTTPRTFTSSATGSSTPATATNDTAEVTACLRLVRVALQSVLHIPQSNVRRACCTNGDTSHRVAGSHDETNLNIVCELVMLHAMAGNDVSHRAAVDRKQHNRGPRTDPRGTPTSSPTTCDCCCPSLTNWVRPSR